MNSKEVCFSHILFPVDYSVQNTALASYVEAMARGNRSRLTLLHVLECPPSWYGNVDTAAFASVLDLASIHAMCQEKLDGYLKNQFQHLVTSRQLLQGDPATEIVQLAKRENVDLIMIPTHGRGAFRRLLLGSVTAKVLHDASCLVWTCSHPERTIPSRYPYRRIVCAVDLSSHSREVIQWGMKLASEHNADIHVVHAIDVNEESTNRGVLAVRRYLCEAALERWHLLEEELKFQAPLRVAYGSVSAAVRKAAHDLEADIVIIGRGQSKEALGRLRTHSYAIIRESPCPVISI